MIKLLKTEIKDENTRENFRRIEQSIIQESLLKGGFKFFTLTFTGTVTNEKIRHNLGYLPKDVIQTLIIGPGVLTWNYGSFTTKFLSVTTTGACTVRAFIGRYEETEV